MGHSKIRYDGYYILQTTHMIPSNEEESKTRENVKVMTSQAQPRRRRRLRTYTPVLTPLHTYTNKCCWGIRRKSLLRLLPTTITSYLFRKCTHSQCFPPPSHELRQQ